MALPLHRTLGELRSDIQTRIGFGMAGSAGVVNSPLIDSFLNDAQEQLYQNFDWLEKRAVLERQTGTNQQHYDYPTDCDIGHISRLSTSWSGKWHDLKEGIDPQDRDYSPGGPPLKYERRDQIEVWPIPSSTDYTLRFEYIRSLARMVATSDRTTIPSHPVFLMALFNAKSHYQQSDAATYGSQLDVLLNALKAKNRGKSVYEHGRRSAGPYEVGTLEFWTP